MENNEVPSAKKIIIKLRRFFSQLQKGNRDAIGTKEITKAFGWLNREAYTQHDVHELNRILLDAIERSLVGTKQFNLINKIYHGTTVYRTFCFECKNCSIKEDDFLDLILDIQTWDGKTSYKNVLESLKQSTQPNYLCGNNKYFCDKCGHKSNAKRSLAYKKLPPVLTIALKR